MLQSREKNLPPLHSNLIATRSLSAELLLQLDETDLATAQLAAALEAWRERPFGFIPELEQAMARFAQAGQCNWLAVNWPDNPSERMAVALSRNRTVCTALH